jgi:hypothetical protein
VALVSKSELIRLQKSLGKDKVIARKFKVTRQWIQMLRQKYGIESRYSINPMRNKEILSLFKEGKTATEIAKKFGISLSYVYLLIAKARRKKK